MRKMSLTFIVIAITSTDVAASADRFDFACHEVKAMVHGMQDGPTDVINRAADDPVAYRDQTIRGWTCLMTPLPPLRNGVPYLQSLDCYADNSDNHVTEQDLSAAGALFQKNLASFNACFGSELLTEAPVTYTHGHRGEGIRAVLSDSYGGHHIIVQYGYLWDTVQTGRIVWQATVGYGEGPGGGSIGLHPSVQHGYKSCSSQCRGVETQCIDSCGPGPDHINNPGWLSCRKSCRSDASQCRAGCLATDSASSDDPDP